MPTNDVIARLIPEQGIRAEFDTIYLYKSLGELAEVAYTGSYTDLIDKPNLGTAAFANTTDFATSAQGGKADTAVQPGELAAVATTGSYTSLTDKPTLGTMAAESASDYTKTSSLAAVALSGSYSDLSGTPTFTSGTGIDITNYTISIADPVLVNEGTGAGGIYIKSYASTKTAQYAISIGSASVVSYSIALGLGSTVSQIYGIAIGVDAYSSAQSAIQLGTGRNVTAQTLQFMSYQLVGANGYIPAARLPIVTSVSSSSTDEQIPSAKLFYDTCGDIETLINAL